MLSLTKVRFVARVTRITALGVGCGGQAASGGTGTTAGGAAGGTYLLFGSHLSGWATNDNQYTTATSLAGPWATWKSFAPTGTNTCNSQSTFVLPVVGSTNTTYVFLADRWNSNNLSDSRYVWLPLTITGTTVSMTCATSWVIDAFTGTWSP